MFLLHAAGVLLLMVAVESPEKAQQGDQGEPRSRKEELRQKRVERLSQLTPYEVSKGEERARWWETNRLKAVTKGYYGIRALVGGMDDPVVFGSVSSGAGFVYGVGDQNGLDRHEFRFNLDARYSTKQYQSVEAQAQFPTLRSKSPVQGFLLAAYRDYKEINFFGLGPESSIHNSFPQPQLPLLDGSGTDEEKCCRIRPVRSQIP